MSAKIRTMAAPTLQARQAKASASFKFTKLWVHCYAHTCSWDSVC